MTVCHAALKWTQYNKYIIIIICLIKYKNAKCIYFHLNKHQIIKLSYR